MPLFRPLLAAFAAAIPVFAINSEPPVIESVTISGAGPDVKLAARWASHMTLPPSLRTFAGSGALGHYSDVRAELDASGSLVFRVVPKPQIRLHEVRFEPNSFGLQAKGAEGSAIDEAGAHQIALDAQRQLQARGYLNARVDYTFARAARVPAL